MTICRQRLEQREQELRAAAAAGRRIGWARLVTLLGGLALLGSVVLTGEPAPGWLWLPLVAFFSLLALHEKADRRRRHADRGADFYRAALARAEGRWAGQGFGGEDLAEPNHPYAADLDIFGPGSLFEFLCRARTAGGRRRLAGWLTQPASGDEIRRRQQAVRELADRIDLREDLHRLGQQLGARLDEQGVRQWAGQPPILPRLPALVGAGLTCLLLAGLTVWLTTGGGLWLVATAALGHFAFTLVFHQRVEQTLASAESRMPDLALVAGLLARLETETFASPCLAELQAGREATATPASASIRRLSRLIRLLDWRRNQIFIPLALLLAWGTHLAFAIDRWHRRHGAEVARWVEAVFEVEALVSLAAFAWENPQHVMPEIVASSEPRLSARGLGHPLIEARRCVRNDLALGPERALLVVSGSNMSGKSTLLRAVGVNVVLAQAGAPVCAEAMSLSTLQVAASIRINDSLSSGVSRFYAEIQRIRQIFDLAAARRPLLFLLDELLAGTNSHDRRIGAEAIVRGLLERGAIGLLTTHDLALTAMVGDLPAAAENVHFEDQLTPQGMFFDYRLEPGVVTHSNALALMREIGLEIPG